MNKYNVTGIQDYLEENSNYFKLIQNRFTNEERFRNTLAAIDQGLSCLGLNKDALKVFEKRSNFVIVLGGRQTDYEGNELPLFIGHKIRSQSF